MGVLKDHIAGVLVILLLLMPQIAHTLYVFEVHSRYDNPWFAWCYAIGVDTAILIFTSKGWLRTAFAYFFATLAHNLVYLYNPDSIWSGLLVCINLSATLYALTHLFIKKKTIPQMPHATGTLKKAIHIQHAIEAGIHFEAHPFECPECGKRFADNKQLNGHISVHKKQNEWKPEHYGNWEEQNQKRYQKLLETPQ
ncbi:C2H2-type zinc finger protein [Aquimarina algicola]|uniref:C2H2-type zinc finger protein n=2 Tax=Aquimarina algicola TaxID=2589995 RepID=A0A504JB97_9FLAO|nr:C2H2-type zinc finger protein [Aquimarina algicola]